MVDASKLGPLLNDIATSFIEFRNNVSKHYNFFTKMPI
jgi:hypothetical protein